MRGYAGPVCFSCLKDAWGTYVPKMEYENMQKTQRFRV